MMKIQARMIAFLTTLCLFLAVLPVSAAQDSPYRVDVKDGIVRFIRNGKMAKYPAAEPVELTVRTDKDGELVVVVRTEDGYRNITLGNQNSLEITGEIGKLFLSASLNPGIPLSIGEKSEIQEMYIRSDGEVTIAGETGKVEVTGAANVIFVGSSYVETLTVSNYRATVSARPGAVLEQVFATSGSRLSGIPVISPLPQPEIETPDTSDSSDRSQDNKVLDKIDDLQVPAPVNPVAPDPDNGIVSVDPDLQGSSLMVLFKYPLTISVEDITLYNLDTKLSQRPSSISNADVYKKYQMFFDPVLTGKNYRLTVKNYVFDFAI